MSYIPDNYDCWKRHDAEQESALNELPVCCQCGEHIQQEDAVRFNDEYICDSCLEDLRVELIWKDDL